MTREAKCTCGGALQFTGEYAAPGFGQSWKCEKCGKPYRKAYGCFTAIEDIDPEDLMLDPADCI